MKLKKLTTAIALTTIAASGTATADNITAALAQGKVSGEAYGGYRDGSLEVSDSGFSGETDSSDLDIDNFRLGFNANIKENVEFGVEIEIDAGDDSGDDSEVLIRDLFVNKTYGDTQVSAGRFKQSANRRAAAEQSNAIIGDSTSVLGAASNALSGLGAPAAATDLIDFAEHVLEGASRRIDGVEVRHANESGLNGTLAVYKAGNDMTGGDISRNFGISASGGWQGGDDDLAFGVSVVLFSEEGDEADDTAVVDELTAFESMGYGVNFNLATGPIVAQLGYDMLENEFDIDGVGSPDDTEIDTLTFEAAWNISGAARAFDPFGVLQGPQMGGEDARGFEIGVSYVSRDLEEGSAEADMDSLALSLNAYCGQYKKFYLSWSTEEVEAGSLSIEADQITLGGRIDF